jgi:hypothetical protein
MTKWQVWPSISVATNHGVFVVVVLSFLLLWLLLFLFFFFLFGQLYYFLHALGTKYVCFLNQISTRWQTCASSAILDLFPLTHFINWFTPPLFTGDKTCAL